MSKISQKTLDRMIDKTFGKITVLSYEGKTSWGENQWVCRCTCGQDILRTTPSIISNKSSCKNCSVDESKTTALLGQTFGRLTVTEYAGKSVKNAYTWKCKCICGNERIFRSDNLLSGLSKSCGCLNREKIVSSSTTHGLYKHPLYKVWNNTKDRCYNPNNESYPYYGAKGIRVEDIWKDSFVEFYKWATTNGYHKGLYIQRLDTSKDYGPDNCIWVTSLEQLDYMTNVRIKSDQISQVINDKRSNVDIAKDYGVSPSTIYRIKTKRTRNNITNSTSDPMITIIPNETKEI